MPGTVSEFVDDLDGKPSIHSFIIRIWMEGSGKKRDHEIWRGRITHIPGDEHQYFTDLNEITVFITTHLADKR